MQEIIACDAGGNSITSLVQWDKDVYIYLSDDGIDSAYDVHFFNPAMDEALVVHSTFEDGALKVKIPNDLLIQPYVITGYVNVVENEEQKCLYCFKINIRKKPKPSSYVYVESHDYVNIEDVLAECRDYAANAGSSAQEAKTEAQNAADSAEAAKNSQTAAAQSEERAAASEENAATSAQTAKDSADAALESKNAAASSEQNADQSAAAAASSATAAASSEESAAQSEAAASTSAENAAASAEQAADSASKAAQSQQAAAASASAAASSAAAAKGSEGQAAMSASAANQSASDADGSAEGAAASASAAEKSAAAAKTSQDSASGSAAEASASATAAKASQDAAAASQSAAAASATAAKTSETAAKASETAAGASATAARNSETAAASSATAAASSAAEVREYANTSRSYAVGDTETRQGEETDNAKYYYEQARRIAQGLEGSLIPMGTIPFSGLESALAQAGYMYNISDAFTTDSSFNEGAGHAYPAGTNVYYTAEGKWDCLAGTQVVSVAGRTGAVTLTKADVGLGQVDNTPDGQKSVASAATATKVGHDLTFAGAVTGSWNGSEAKTVTIPTIPGALKNPNALTFTGGSKVVYDGSTAQTVAIPTTLPASGGTSAACSGNAATATKFAAPHNINGVAFDGSKDITVRADPTMHTATNSTAVDALNPATGFYNVENLDMKMGDGRYHRIIALGDHSAKNYATEIAFPYQSGVNANPQIRTSTASAWSAWKKLAFYDDITGYAPAKGGAGATGTWGIGISGNAATATKLAAAKKINGVEFDGSKDITVADSTKLPLTGGTVTGTLILSKTTDASGTANSSPALIVGGAVTARHLELDSNEVMAKKNATATDTLFLNNDGGLVTVGAGGLLSNGDLTLSGTIRNIKYASGTRTGSAITFYAGDVNGSGMVIGDGGRTIIGAGEAAQNLRGALGGSDSSEELHLANDGPINLHTNCQTIANRRTFTFQNDGRISNVSNPTAATDVANKQYVDNALAAKQADIFYRAVTLAVASWNATAKTQTVTVSGVVAAETSQLIIPTPALASRAAYQAAGIQATAQGVNTVTFTAETVPTVALTVYVTVVPL